MINLSNIRQDRQAHARLVFLAARGDLGAQLQVNLAEARVIEHETSARRLRSKNAFSQALDAVRRLHGTTLAALNKKASQDWHSQVLATLEASLTQSRLNAQFKAFDVPAAHDVFVLLSQFLGLSTIPEKIAKTGKPAPQLTMAMRGAVAMKMMGDSMNQMQAAKRATRAFHADPDASAQASAEHEEHRQNQFTTHQANVTPASDPSHSMRNSNSTIPPRTGPYMPNQQPAANATHATDASTKQADQPQFVNPSYAAPVPSVHEAMPTSSTVPVGSSSHLTAEKHAPNVADSLDREVDNLANNHRAPAALVVDSSFYQNIPRVPVMQQPHYDQPSVSQTMRPSGASWHGTPTPAMSSPAGVKESKAQAFAPAPQQSPQAQMAQPMLHRPSSDRGFNTQTPQTMPAAATSASQVQQSLQGENGTTCSSAQFQPRVQSLHSEGPLRNSSVYAAQPNQKPQQYYPHQVPPSPPPYPPGQPQPGANLYESQQPPQSGATFFQQRQPPATSPNQVNQLQRRKSESLPLSKVGAKMKGAFEQRLSKLRNRSKTSEGARVPAPPQLTPGMQSMPTAHYSSVPSQSPVANTKTNTDGSVPIDAAAINPSTVHTQQTSMPQHVPPSQQAHVDHRREETLEGASASTTAPSSVRLDESTKVSQNEADGTAHSSHIAERVTIPARESGDISAPNESLKELVISVGEEEIEMPDTGQASLDSSTSKFVNERREQQTGYAKIGQEGQPKEIVQNEQREQLKERAQTGQEEQLNENAKNEQEEQLVENAKNAREEQLGIAATATATS